MYDDFTPPTKAGKLGFLLGSLLFLSLAAAAVAVCWLIVRAVFF